MDIYTNHYLSHAIKGSLCLLSIFVNSTQASIINDTMEFSNLNQSMWKAGNTSNWNVERTIATQWDTQFNIGDITGSKDVCIGGRVMGHCVGIDDVDTRTGAQVGVESSGRIGLKLNAAASGGSVDVFLPVSTSINIGDVSATNELFNISTQFNIKNSASITANAPSFSAGLKGILDIDLKLSAVACATFAGCAGGTTNIGLHAGEFDLFGIDLNRDKPFDVFGYELPFKVFDTPRNIHMPTPTNPDGVVDEPTPENPEPPQPMTPIIGDITFHTLKDKTGGSVAGSKLSLETNQNVLDAGISLTGLMEAQYGSPGLLHNEFKQSIGPVKAKIEYNALGFDVGPTLGMQQKFDIDPNVSVRLEFDQPITRMEPKVIGHHDELVCKVIVFKRICKIESVPIIEYRPETYQDGIVDMLLGDNADYFFEGAVGNLLNRTYFLDDPLFSNLTSATLDPFAELKVGCLKVKFAATVHDECLVEKKAQTNGLASARIYDNSWAMGGFQEYSFASTIIDDTVPPVSVSEPKTLYILALSLFAFMLRSKRFPI
ncbi:hypothetical protein AADZ91_08400 [Colwelliaceae bacterium 6441]